MTSDALLRRATQRLVAAILISLLCACGGVAFHLPEHSAEHMSVPVRLAAGEQRLALSTPSGAGADLRLASENPAIVAIEVREHGMGAADLTLVAKAPGSARVHYVNRSMLPRDPVKRAQIDYIRAASLGSFLVTVK